MLFIERQKLHSQIIDQLDFAQQTYTVHSWRARDLELSKIRQLNKLQKKRLWREMKDKEVTSLHSDCKKKKQPERRHSKNDWSGGKFSSKGLTWFLTRASSAANKGTQQKISRHKWKKEKPENITLIGILTDAVERNPRENTQAIPANRPIDLFIASADLLSCWNVSQFPLLHWKVRTIFVVIRVILGERSENVRMRARGLFRFGKIKDGGVCGQDKFWRTVHKMWTNGTGRE